MYSPDQVLPATSTTTYSENGRVNLRMEKTGPGSLSPISFPGLLSKTAHEYPDYPALAFKGEDQKWNFVTYRGFSSGMYITNTADACKYYADKCRANIIVVEDNQQLNKILKIKDSLKHLRAIVQYRGEPQVKGVVSWKKLLKIGEEVPDSQLDDVMKTKCINECCSILFTSGTSGQPKAAMLSHDNITWCSITTPEENPLQIGKEVIVTYLPLNHMATQALDVYKAIHCAGTVYFADKDALKMSTVHSSSNTDSLLYSRRSGWLVEVNKASIILGPLHLHALLVVAHSVSCDAALGPFEQCLHLYLHTFGSVGETPMEGSLLKTIKEAQPTHFFGVPRIWEKIYEKMQNDFIKSRKMARAIVSWAQKCSLQHYVDKMNGKHRHSASYLLAEKLVLSKIKKELGFDGCRKFMTGSAPTSVDIKKFFMSIDIPVLEVFGMTETSGIHLQCQLQSFNFEAIGKDRPGICTRTENPDENGNGEGATCVHGYLGDPERTAEVLKDDWLHSGDLGKKDEDGFITITGRIKEMISTAGGENVAPFLIEEVKKELPCIRNAMVVGERRKYLIILLTMKTELNVETGEPLDELTEDTKQWCREIGYEVNTVKNVLEGSIKKIMAAIQKGIDVANTRAISHVHRVKKFAILPHDFSNVTGELAFQAQMPTERVFSLMNNKWTDQRNQCSLELIKSELMVEINYDYGSKEFLKFAQEDKNNY